MLNNTVIPSYALFHKCTTLRYIKERAQIELVPLSDQMHTS